MIETKSHRSGLNRRPLGATDGNTPALPPCAPSVAPDFSAAQGAERGEIARANRPENVPDGASHTPVLPTRLAALVATLDAARDHAEAARIAAPTDPARAFACLNSYARLADAARRSADEIAWALVVAAEGAV